MKTTHFVLALLGTLFFVDGAAAQNRRGVVLAFSGPRAGVARNAVVSAASERLELVPQDEFDATAQRLGADLDDPTGIAQVAQEMDLDVVVRGEVRGRRRRARTIIRVLDREGNEVARRESGSAAGRAGRRRVERAAGQAIDQALESIPEREPEPAEEPPPPQDDFLGGGMDDEVPGDGDLEEEEEAPGERLAVPLFEIMVGIGFRTRSAEVQLQTGGVRGYDAGLFPEITFRLMARPFAGDDGALRGVFAHFEFFHSIGLTSRDQMSMMEIGSSALRAFGQLGYLVDAGGLEIGGGLGVGYDAFNLDMNTTMSSAQYTYLRPALMLRAPLSDELVQLQVEGGLRAGLSTGGLAPMFAASASHFAFDAGASLFGNLDNGFAYALRLGYVSYGLSFEGDAAMAADQADLDAGGSDGYFFVTLNGGYQFR